MRILFIGDIVGANGRQVVADHLPSLIEEYNIDFVIANGENAAHGKGITKKIYDFFMNIGINCVTMGNHTFAKREIYDFYDECENLLVPGNMLPIDFGNYYKVFEVNNKKICVINLYGEAFMNNVGGSPYIFLERALKHCKADYYFVDFHAESTSEKMLFANYYKERINALVGTHTHVQTADNRMIGKVAYISDVGMCGAYDSIIGRDVDEITDNVIYGNKTHFKVAEGEAFLNAVVITVDDNMVSQDIIRVTR
jgi:2',3'-cyclic-nucleotide 2'-phosphodiesterase